MNESASSNHPSLIKESGYLKSDQRRKVLEIDNANNVAILIE